MSSSLPGGKSDRFLLFGIVQAGVGCVGLDPAGLGTSVWYSGPTGRVIGALLCTDVTLANFVGFLIF